MNMNTANLGLYIVFFPLRKGNILNIIVMYWNPKSVV